MKPKKLRRPALMLSVCLITTMQSVFSQGVFLTNEHSQIVPTDNTNKEFTVMPLVTVVELKNSDDLNAKQFKGYQFPGVLDGIGALKMDENTVRFFINHEFTRDTGYFYMLENSTILTGARVSYVDMKSNNRKVEGAGMAYTKIYDRSVYLVTSADQVSDEGGIRRLCSAALLEAGVYGLEDDIFFTGEETGGGIEYALDVANVELWAVPWMGKAAWESVTMLETGKDNLVAIQVGDDRAPAPLILYIGVKNFKNDGSFLDRNGLAFGSLYVFVSDEAGNPEDYNGTGEELSGTFVEINHYNPILEGTEGYDELGFAIQDQQDVLAAEVGAFLFSRPEDVATNPENGMEAVLASTGIGQLYPSDNWGTLYTVNINFADLSSNLKILYDGDDAGEGQFSDPDFGLRSPDNLDWADTASFSC